MGNNKNSTVISLIARKIMPTLLMLLIIGLKTEAQQYHFVFDKQDKNTMNNLTNIISIDYIKKNKVSAYANNKEFSKFKQLNIPYKMLPKSKISVAMAQSIEEMANWDKYPTYDVYMKMMAKYAQDYPDICRVDTIGYSVNNRLILVCKISDNATEDEPEPEFFYTSTMHGDEVTGYILMLRLIDYLLNNYNTDSYVKSLIDSFEIYINPLSNPDGTYYGGDNTIDNARRYNANNADLNRDFPDPRIGENAPYQKETRSMMDFAKKHNFIMSANLHGGAEVMNYPWDTWDESDNPHADKNWFTYTCSQYVDTARKVKSTYMSDVTSSGVTNGGDWYVITGGRQDYMNYYRNCREVTIEISTTKILSADLLPEYWEINKKSLLYFIENSGYGFRGKVTDESGKPLQAIIQIQNHDKDNSFAVTDSITGWYFRPVEPGNYTVTFSADGYESYECKINVSEWNSIIRKDITLYKSTKYASQEIKNIKIYPNPSEGNFKLTNLPAKTDKIIVYNTNGQILQQYQTISQEVNFSITDYHGMIFLLIITKDNNKIIKKALIR